MAALLTTSLAFAVNGSGLPDVNFDVGESYAGLLPISNSTNETRELFFWYGGTLSEELARAVLTTTLFLGSFHRLTLRPKMKSLLGENSSEVPLQFGE